MNQKGITLVELIVVMVIIAIGATLLAPNIGAWMPIYRLKGATRDIISTMRVAQMKAVSNNNRYRVTFDPLNKKFYLENSQDSGGSWAKEGEDQILPDGVQLNTTFVDNIVTFYPNSTAMQGNLPSTLQTGSITIVNTKGSQKTIQLWGTTGRIKHG